MILGEFRSRGSEFFLRCSNAHSSVEVCARTCDVVQIMPSSITKALFDLSWRLHVLTISIVDGRALRPLPKMDDLRDQRTSPTNWHMQAQTCISNLLELLHHAQRPPNRSLL